MEKYLICADAWLYLSGAVNFLKQEVNLCNRKNNVNLTWSLFRYV